MDTSEQYIKMCEKADEIQKEWKPYGGDWYLHNYHGTTGLTKEVEEQVWGNDKEKWEHIEILSYKPDEAPEYFVSTDGEKSHITSAKDLLKDHCIWIPRQDQLQEMWMEFEWGNPQPINRIASMIQVFSDWLNEDLPKFESMEQLWFAFVMSEKFGKVWDGNDWKEK